MRHVLATVVLAPLFAIPALTAPAAAADLAPAAVPYYKAPPAVVMGWTGGYVGISAGGRWADTTWTSSSISLPPGPPDPDALAVVIRQLDRQVRRLSRLQLADRAAMGDRRRSRLCLGPRQQVDGRHSGHVRHRRPGQRAGRGGDGGVLPNVTLNWDGSVRGRLGFLVAPNWLLYGTGGLAFQEVDLNASCNGAFISWCIIPRNETASTTQLGWTVGGGIETQMWRNWLLRAEYRYSDYGNIGHTFFAGTIDQVVMQEQVRTHTALVGLAYKFGN